MHPNLKRYSINFQKLQDSILVNGIIIQNNQNLDKKINNNIFIKPKKSEKINRNRQTKLH